MTIPTTEPLGFRAGDTLRWTRKAVNSEGDQLDPADSWTLTYELRNANGTITITASDNGDGAHLVSVANSVTAAYAPGLYAWEAYADDGSQRWTIDAGTFSIEPDFSALATHEARSWARRTLEKVEAALEGAADHDVASYTIGGVSLARISRAELLDHRRRLRAEVSREEQAERVANGLGHRGIVRVRM